MKFIIIFVSLAIVAVHATITDEQKQLVAATRSKCEKESGLASEQAEKMRKGELIDDPQAKKYLVCFFKTVEVVDGSGNFKSIKLDSGYGSIIGKDNAEKINQECIKKDMTIQDSVFEFAKCAFKYRPKELYGQ